MKETKFIFSKDVIDQEIKFFKILGLITILMQAILLILGIFFKSFLVVSIAFSSVTIAYAAVMPINIKKYGLRAEVLSDKINIYNYRDRLIKTIYLSSIKIKQNNVLISRGGRGLNRIERICTCLYSNDDLDETIDYFWNKDKSLIVIDNVELVEELKNFIDW